MIMIMMKEKSNFLFELENARDLNTSNFISDG